MKSIATDTYDFEHLVTDGYAHVDKTDMPWQLANGKNKIIKGLAEAAAW